MTFCRKCLIQALFTIVDFLVGISLCRFILWASELVLIVMLIFRAVEGSCSICSHNRAISILLFYFKFTQFSKIYNVAILVELLYYCIPAFHLEQTDQRKKKSLLILPRQTSALPYFLPHHHQYNSYIH